MSVKGKKIFFFLGLLIVWKYYLNYYNFIYYKCFIRIFSILIYKIKMLFEGVNIVKFINDGYYFIVNYNV